MLEQLWDECNQEMVREVAETFGIKTMKAYDRRDLDELLGALWGVDDIALHAGPETNRDYTKAAELMTFLKGKVHKSGLDTVSSRSNTLEVKYLSRDAPTTETLQRIERTLERARAISTQVVSYLEVQQAAHPVNELLGKVLTHHFKFKTLEGSEFAANFAKMIQNYRSIQRGLSTKIRLSDALARYRGKAGYVTIRKVEPGNFHPPGVRANRTVHEPDCGGVFVAGSLHITFNKFLKEQTDLNHTPQTKIGLAGLIIHEASHKFCYTKDHAYTYQQERYEGLTTIQALDNADSYALAAVSLHCGRLIEDSRADILERRR